MKDQVGNIRLTYTGSGSTVTVLQRDEYYPFGNTFDSYLGSGGANTYKFNGIDLRTIFVKINFFLNKKLTETLMKIKVFFYSLCYM